MSADMEQVAREGMRQFTAGMQVSPDLAARTYAHHRRRRRRRQLAGLAGATVAVAVAATVAGTTLVPAASHQSGDHLTAWTVVKRSDGSIDVAIRQLSDPAGLQSTLRDDGLPAVVDFNGQLPSACQPYPPISRALARRIFQPQPSGARTGGTVLTIHPSALPSGAGVQIGTTVSRGHLHSSIDLVYASSQCTG